MMKKYIQPILKAIGYYKVKSKWRIRQTARRWQKEDAERNAKVRQEIYAIDKRILPAVQKSGNITVSLTSHGSRLERVAPYAIYSILQQTVLPNRIVLNIDQTQWNDDNLPELIKKLMVAGLEINYCEDVGPHTKLLPTLEKYPEDIVITVDDDIIYERVMVEELIRGYHESDKKAIVTRWAVLIIFKDGKMQPYSIWPESSPSDPIDTLYGPLGVAGVLYPPHIFTDEVFNKAVYRKLCKTADDIWYTIQAYINHIPVYYLRDTIWTANHPVDRYAEYVEQDSDALHFHNIENGHNDVQLKNLIDYYHIND